MLIDNTYDILLSKSQIMTGMEFIASPISTMDVQGK